MNAIVAVDKNWAIGRENGLLAELPGDMKYFREKTRNKVIVVGRRTLESFPGAKPLPSRTNIVLSRDPNFLRDDCIVLRSREEVLERISEYDSDDVYICGGGYIYKLFLEDCDAFYVTKIDEAFEADTYFPNLDELGYVVDWSSESQQDNGISYRFLRYVKADKE